MQTAKTCRTYFIGFLAILVILYILVLSGYTEFKTDILTKRYFTNFGKNKTKFKIPKPVYIQLDDGNLPKNGNKELPYARSLKSTGKSKTRPRNATDYEKGHVEMCKNSWQEDYTKLHRRLIETNQNKFLPYRCSKAGWGNRLRDLLSSFHVAVVARRAFIINCNLPSPLDRYLEPRHIKWNYTVNETRLSVRKKNKIILNDIKNLSDSRIFEKMLNYSVEYTPQLVGNKNKFLANIVKYDLPVWPHQMYGCSFYYLFKKSDILQKRLDEWKEKLGFKENIVIAIHIREGDSVFHHNQGDKRFKDRDSIELSFNCVMEIEKRIQEKYKTKNIIWFLAADSEKMKEFAREKYGNKVKHINGPIEHVGHPTKGNEDAGQFTMFLDYFLMQESDYRIYTGPSTFDDAIEFITLGTSTSNVGRTWYRRRRGCIIPSHLKP